MSDQKKLYEYLAGFLREERKEKFERNVRLRTRYVTIAVEDIYQPHNASAVLRSAECFGVQDVHIVENRNKYVPNPDVVMGASKWLSLHRYGGEKNNTLNCIRALKKNGYRIIATTPHRKDCLISELDLSKGKLALFFGTENEGLSPEILQEADEFVKIPMYGFTESFNISVSAAICLYELIPKLQRSGIHWQLSEEEQAEILMQWVRSSLQRPELLEDEFRKKQSAGE
ncbi:MAG TPA: RNA methyltransferase [Bacteroidia bacterium]|nr:RNA methyltransferase [Bacteroidia bacterium]